MAFNYILCLYLCILQFVFPFCVVLEVSCITIIEYINIRGESIVIIASLFHERWASIRKKNSSKQRWRMNKDNWYEFKITNIARIILERQFLICICCLMIFVFQSSLLAFLKFYRIMPSFVRFVPKSFWAIQQLLKNIFITYLVLIFFFLKVSNHRLNKKLVYCSFTQILILGFWKAKPNT